MMLQKWVHKAICGLIGLWGLSACMAEDEVLLVNPEYDGDHVQVECNLIVPQVDGKSMGSRMTAGNVQQDKQFRGIDSLFLFPFQKVGPTGLQGYEIVSSDQWEVLKNSIKGQVSWQQDMQIPIGTNHVLLYGKATNDKLGFDQGWTNSSLGNITSVVDPPQRPRLDDVTFRPQLITTETAVNAALESVGYKWIKQMLNKVSNAKYEEQIFGFTIATYVFYKEEYYKTFIVDQEVMSASPQAFLAKLEKLYNATKTGMESGLVKAIKTAITTPITIDGKIVKVDYNNTLSFHKDGGYVVPSGLHQLVGIPEGAVKMQFSHTTNGYDMTGPATCNILTTANIDDLGRNVWDVYAYPAELYYISNSAVACSQAKHKDDAPQSWDKTKWNQFIAKYYTDDPVDPFTRSMVVKNEMQYGVACMAAGVLNKTGIQGLRLTGVLVRGQREVGWNFTHLVTGLFGDPFVVYDCKMNGKNGKDYIDIPDNQSKPSEYNYTLLYPTAGLDNPPVFVQDPNQRQTEKVKVWLEFENNSGGDIQTNNKDKNVILKGTRFYIGATLDLYEAIRAQYPDESSFNKNQRKHLFESDFMTKVTFTLENLQGAIDVIPETKQTSAEVGVSVNIQWEKGFVFQDVEVEGDGDVVPPTPTPPGPEPEPEPEPEPQPTPGTTDVGIQVPGWRNNTETTDWLNN